MGYRDYKAFDGDNKDVNLLLEFFKLKFLISSKKFQILKCSGKKYLERFNGYA